MEHDLSVEENLNHFWAPPPPPLQPQMIAEGVDGIGAFDSGSGVINSYTSELYLEKFEETPLDDPATPSVMNSSASMTILYPNSMIGGSQRAGYGDEAVEMILMPIPTHDRAVSTMDPVEYNAMLKRQLDMDLAAVAMWRAAGALRPKNSPGNRASPNLDGSNLSIQNYTKGHGILVQNKTLYGPTEVPDPLVQNADAHVKHATSPSSGEPSPSDDDDDDDDMEGATSYIVGNIGLTPEKIKKRKESNRESARRSRCRKAAHLKDLEEQVSQLRIENSTLLRRLVVTSQKYNIAIVDNRVLKADIETLKAKVKMAEETMRRVTCTKQLPQDISNMPSFNIPVNGSPSNVTSGDSVAIEDNHITYFSNATNATVNNNHMPEIDPTFRIEDMINGVVSTSRTTSSMNQTTSQNVMNLQPLQRRVCGALPSSESMPWGSALFGSK